MEIVLSRLLKYLNGCLVDDCLYQLGLFIVQHYENMADYDLNTLTKETALTKQQIIEFCQLLGFDNYETFQSQLLVDHMLRSQQIHSRMMEIKVQDFIQHLDSDYERKQLSKQIENICKLLFKSKRIVLMGSLYPMSISVEFQTDFITFGKEVVQYHHFLKDFEFHQDDVIIFISATGRSMESYLKNKKDQHIQDAHMILMTQNVKYVKQLTPTYQVIQVPGKFDGIQFNYQMMLLFDILRICYYHQYYI